MKRHSYLVEEKSLWCDRGSEVRGWELYALSSTFFGHRERIALYAMPFGSGAGSERRGWTGTRQWPSLKGSGNCKAGLNILLFAFATGLRSLLLVVEKGNHHLTHGSITVFLERPVEASA